MDDREQREDRACPQRQKPRSKEEDMPTGPRDRPLTRSYTRTRQKPRSKEKDMPTGPRGRPWTRSYTRTRSCSLRSPVGATVGSPGSSLVEPIRGRGAGRVSSLVRLELAGPERLKPELRKYFSSLSLDPNTAHLSLKLSNNNKTVTYVGEKQSYPDHQDRFDFWIQILCSSGLTGRCYWEVKWSGHVSISVSYRGIKRKGNSLDSGFGLNDKSWILFCSKGRFSVHHENKHTDLRHSPSSSSGTVAVYLDCEAGSLSFYSVSSSSSSERLILLHTFNTTFTEPLFPGFWLHYLNSSVTLLD